MTTEIPSDSSPLTASPTPESSGPTRVYSTPVEWQEALLDELKRVHPGSEHWLLSPGWLASRLVSGEDEGTPALVFVSQSYPSPTRIESESINGFARAVLPRLLASLKSHEGPWRLQISCLPVEGSTGNVLRCQRIEAAVLELLKDKQRRLLRTRTPDPVALWQPGEVLVQLGLETTTVGWWSVTFPEERIRLRRILSRFPGGLFHVEDDLKPPSSAFKKVVEGQALLGRPIRKGERCVDLGGCPGGWTYIAVQAGAQVTAVDRSPLRDDLMAHRRVDFVQGDAFRYVPVAPVDWLLCDVIAFPKRSIAMLDQWLSEGWCRHFIVTLKFKGKEDYPAVEEAKAMLSQHPVDFIIRHLNVNRNEVTMVGSRGNTPRKDPAKSVTT